MPDSDGRSGRRLRLAGVVVCCLCGLFILASGVGALSAPAEQVTPGGANVTIGAGSGTGNAISDGTGSAGDQPTLSAESGEPDSAPSAGNVTRITADRAFRGDDEDVHFVVTAEQPSYWRIAGYDSYRGDGWERSAGGPIHETPPGDRSRDVLLHEVRFEIPAEVVPTAGRAIDIDSSAGDVTYGSESAVFLQETAEPGTTVTVTSLRPETDPATLQTAGTDYPQAVVDRYTTLPESVPDRVHERASSLTDDADTPFEAATTLESWFKSNYEYAPDVEPPDGNVTDELLFEREAAHSAYFASAMAVVLRSEEIPARYVVGYNAGNYDPANESYVVRGIHTHAWVEVYFPEHGWVPFDPTPTRDRVETLRRTTSSEPAADEFQYGGDRNLENVSRGGEDGSSPSGPGGENETNEQTGGDGEQSNESGQNQESDQDQQNGGNEQSEENDEGEQGEESEDGEQGEGETEDDGNEESEQNDEGEQNDESEQGEDSDASSSESGSESDNAESGSGGAGGGGSGAQPGETENRGSNQPRQNGNQETAADYRIELLDSAVPGKPLPVRVLRGEQPVQNAPVTFDGAVVGRTDENGTVAATVPFQETLNIAAYENDTVGAPNASQDPVASKRVSLPTEIDISVEGPTYPGSTVNVTTTIDGAPVESADVTLDGQLVERTNQSGTVSVALPDRTGTVTLEIERGAATGNTTIQLANVTVAVDAWPAVLPGNDATVTVTYEDGNPVAGATVRRDGAAVLTTGEDGTGTMTATAAFSSTVSVERGNWQVTTTVHPLRNLLIGLVPLLVLATAGVVVSRWVGFRPLVLLAAGVRVAIKRSISGLIRASGAVARLWFVFRRRVSAAQFWPVAALVTVFRGAGIVVRAGATAISGAVRSLWAAIPLGGPPEGGTDSPGEDGPRSPSRTVVRRAWNRVVSLAPVGRPATHTPADIAERAIRAGLPHGPVETILSAFQSVEYGEQTPDEVTHEELQDAMNSLDDEEE